MLKKMKKSILFKAILIIAIIGFLFSSYSSLALNAKLSNESLQAKELLNQAEKDIFEMISKNINILRVNETYQDAVQLYSAQLALEEKGSNANYNLVIEYTSKVSSIKKIAVEAKDELEIFKEVFENAEKESNLSEMQKEYEQIITSFNEERFEDTLKLIKKGYLRISEIQSSQTAVKLFYLTTSRTIKNFFTKYGLKIAIIISITIFSLLIFWSSLTKLRRRIRLNNLVIQKKAINGLVKDMQGSYFKSKKMSEGEYNIKLKKYEELIRDIDRQIMVLKEEIFKSKPKSN